MYTNNSRDTDTGYIENTRPAEFGVSLIQSSFKTLESDEYKVVFRTLE